MREYDEQILAKLHAVELEILRDFVKVCEENNLTYFGFGGTGIGALRHGGFIPWDDDIDLAIPRDDYNKALEIIKRDYADKYTVVNAEEFDEFPVMNTHIILNGTLFVVEEEKDLKYPHGIFLDIFPLDNAPSDDKKARNYMRKAWFLSKLLILKHLPFPMLPLNKPLDKIGHIITWCVWAFLNVFCVSHKFLYKCCIKACTKYNGQDTGVYTFACDTNPFTSTFKKEDILPLRKIKFEDMEINFPNKLEENLTGLYGDFMQLPPPEKRKNHFPFKLKFPNEDEILQ